MAKNLSKTGITTNSTVRAGHVTQSIDAFTGDSAYDITISGSLTVTGSTDIQGNITAVSMSGDGSGITGVTAEWDGSHDGNANITGSLTITGSSLSNQTTIYDFLTLTLSSGNDQLLMDPSNGIQLGDPDGNDSISVWDRQLLDTATNDSIDWENRTLTDSTGNIKVNWEDSTFSGSFSGSFQGDGSGLTGITAEWDGSHNGNASITGSLTVTGNISSSLDILGGRHLSNGNIFAISDSGTTTLGGIEKTKLSGTDITLDASVTASSDISASGNIYASSGTIPTLISPLEITGNSGLTVEGSINMTATEYVFLPPRVTTTQKNAIINIAGSVVFDTDLAKLCINNGSSWETITSA